MPTEFGILSGDGRHYTPHLSPHEPTFAAHVHTPLLLHAARLSASRGFYTIIIVIYIPHNVGSKCRMYFTAGLVIVLMHIPLRRPTGASVVSSDALPFIQSDPFVYSVMYMGPGSHQISYTLLLL